ncbi:hypothetical protein SKAU_G00154890 [Synaphobranchus kaupii]|uniref:Peptidase S1 domain-containing protein n=1 Tax=Synaphobranchus kaupii TaxID=118154 RepID=A0A9Q1IX22_SYNKA|nr:hypothetical protein SKAU_G00154890 [Synaphobranchus kaupii]
MQAGGSWERFEESFRKRSQKTSGQSFASSVHHNAVTRTRRVVLGDHTIYTHEGTEQYIDVSHIFLHPSWDANELSSGALRNRMMNATQLQAHLREQRATLNSYVQVAALPPSGQTLPKNNLCYITGWGRTHRRPAVSLPEGGLPACGRPRDRCAHHCWWGSTVKSNMICAGGRSFSGCHGDSGGPLNCKVNGTYYVHGVTGFVSSLGCNMEQKPTVFTHVSAYIGWMNSVRTGKGAEKRTTADSQSQATSTADSQSQATTVTDS